MRYLVVGLGISGTSVATFLLERGEEVIAVDRNAAALFEKAKPLLDQGLILKGEEEVSEEWLCQRQISCAILSPGISPKNPVVQALEKARVEKRGEIEFAFRHLQGYQAVGITGTNGKTTTVLLLTHLLNEAGKKAVALGNVGRPLTDSIGKLTGEEILVIELSSYQLESLKSPFLDRAAILNITPDHLERHGSMEGYARAKGQIISCLKPGGNCFIGRGVLEEFPQLFSAVAPIVPLDYKSGWAPLEGKERPNLVAAAAIARSLGLSDEEIRRGAETFQKPPHRIEWVAEIDGVAYYNDSKATNIDAVLHAVALFDRPLILLAGGADKGAPYAPWIAPFQGKVRRVIAFGAAGPKIEQELLPHFPLVRVGGLKEALSLAKREAKRGEVVLFSPGCASFDEFRNYEHRGEEFRKWVKAL